MTQKRLAQRVPPLSHETLTEVLAIERNAGEQVRKCHVYESFNVDAAIQILRTALVSALDLRLKEYTSRHDYNPEWTEQIKDIAFRSLLGSVGELSDEQHIGRIKTELLFILRDHVTPATTKEMEVEAEPQKQSELLEALGKQIERLRDECRLTVEQLAEKIGVSPRTVYRHISGKAEPRKTQLAAYEKCFSDRLRRAVRLKA